MSQRRRLHTPSGDVHCRSELHLLQPRPRCTIPTDSDSCRHLYNPDVYRIRLASLSKLGLPTHPAPGDRQPQPTPRRNGHRLVEQLQPKLQAPFFLSSTTIGAEPWRRRSTACTWLPENTSSIPVKKGN